MFHFLYRSRRAIMLLFCLPLIIPSLQAQIKKRNQSFVGIHFDFHASPNDTLIGQHLTEGMIDSLLTKVKPDYIQIDCKGHRGIVSYPTKYGNAPHTFVKDPMKLFRSVTQKHGVALYAHYSGIWDNRAITDHPNWARMNKDGTSNKEKVSFWSPYLDSLLIPQLKEISDYGLDGAWVDGDCWAADIDFRTEAIDDFKKETGIRQIPEDENTPEYKVLREFTRKKFREYLRHYLSAIHEYNPNFQITSNWAYSSIMPEEVDTPVDFLSGDLNPNNSVLSGAYEARFLAPQGKPWDLMSWSFGGNASSKSAVQLCQEASQVIAMGGGFQVYWYQLRDASLQTWAYDIMSEVAVFCRQRQAFCQNAQPIPQAAILFSNKGYKEKTTKTYGGDHDAVKGIMHLLLDNQIPTELRMTHTLKGQMQAFPLIVVPEWEHLDSSEITDLKAYAKGGGTLLIMGYRTVKHFEDILGVTLKNEIKSAVNIGSNDLLTGVNSPYQSFIADAETKTFGTICRTLNLKDRLGPAASISDYGKGKVAAIYTNLGEVYKASNPYLYKVFMKEFMKTLYTPDVTVEGSQYVYVTLNKKNNKTLINLLNVAGEHRSVASFNQIPVINNLQVRFRTAVKPKEVRLQPENKKLPFIFKQGEIEVKMPALQIHSILEIH